MDIYYRNLETGSFVYLVTFETLREALTAVYYDLEFDEDDNPLDYELYIVDNHGHKITRFTFNEDGIPQEDVDF